MFAEQARIKLQVVTPHISLATVDQFYKTLLAKVVELAKTETSLPITIHVQGLLA
jgi:hypothetical protein